MHTAYLKVIALLVVFEFLNYFYSHFLKRYTSQPYLYVTGIGLYCSIVGPLHHKLEKWAMHKLVEKNRAIQLAATKKIIEPLEK